jgi:hypothetical protein
MMWAQKVIKMLLDASVLRGWMNLIRGITARGFPSPFVVYTWDTDALDMPKVNRRKSWRIWLTNTLNWRRKKSKNQTGITYTRFKLKIFPDEQENPCKSWWYWCTRAFCWLAENSNLLIAPKHLRLIAGRATAKNGWYYCWTITECNIWYAKSYQVLVSDTYVNCLKTL